MTNIIGNNLNSINVAVKTPFPHKTMMQKLARIKGTFTSIISASLLLTLAACKPDVSQPSLESIYNAKKDQYPLTTRHLNEEQEPLFINQLIKENSLYLLQHANNPVQWRAWGDDAFAQAKALNKPIFLSIGYSTCHWCHVMARESFEDIEVANFINQHFIPIKVDREEHPAVDELYLTSVQMLSGKAGWPLTAVLTPDGQAFFGGTYFQPPALLNVLDKINNTWLERQDAVLEQANRITTALAKITQASSNTKAVDNAVIADAVTRIKADLSAGASSRNQQSKPGFPREPEMLFLLDQAQRSLSESTIDVVTDRLLKLAAGGIHDQIGGGFHRYTVDSQWVIPHFEKMLYNQAQMAKSYFLAYHVSANPQLKTVGDKTLRFLLNEMQAPEGGFYSAIDAESKGADGIKGEGEYYLWTYAQLTSLLTKDELSIAETIFDVTPQGNFQGASVLQNTFFNSSEAKLNRQTNHTINSILSKLSAARKQRPTPSIDTKIITSWNAMAIGALATAYAVSGNDEYLQAATKAANRLWESSYNPKDGVARTLPKDRQWVSGTLEDYAYLAGAFVDLYDLSGNKAWLQRAEQITEQMITRFHDQETGGFRIGDAARDANRGDAHVPVINLVSARDDATYSGNSMAAQVLARLSKRTAKPQFKHTANEVIAAFSQQLLANPEALSGMLLAANTLHNGDTGGKQYAAKGKIAVSTNASDLNQFKLTITVDDGWHINAAQVLSDYLIPTKLTPITQGRCPEIGDVSYPKGKLVELGFQEDKLLVYDNTVTLTVTKTQQNCGVLAADLHVQACSDQVCLPPEKLKIRAF